MTSIKQNNNNKNNKSSNTYPNASSVCKVPFVTFMIMTTTGIRYFKRWACILKGNYFSDNCIFWCDDNITPKIKWMKAPREDYDCLDDGVKLVAHEVKFYFSDQIQRTSGQTNTYLKLEIYWTFELLPGGNAANRVQRARTGGHLPQTWLQVSFYSCFLSDPSPIIGNACHSLPDSLTP